MVTVLSMLAFGTAFALGTTFGVRFVARRIGLVDRPDGRRKFQSQPVALAGGVAVLVSAFATLVAAALARPEIAESMDENFEKVLALGVAALGIVLVGLIDDAVNLRARYKLAGQLGAACVLVFGGGFAIDEVSAFGTVIPLGSAAVPVAVFWFVGAMNAFNLLDGMDGLLGTLALIIVGSLAGMAFAGGNPFVGWVAVALAGGLVGFLRFNLPPATIYLGDAGSMLVGLCVAALAIGACQKGPAVAIVAPTVLLVLPILDTTAAIVRRTFAGRALAASDLGHLHHVLQRAGMSRVRSRARGRTRDRRRERSPGRNAIPERSARRPVRGRGRHHSGDDGLVRHDRSPPRSRASPSAGAGRARPARPRRLCRPSQQSHEACSG